VPANSRPLGEAQAAFFFAPRRRDSREFYRLGEFNFWLMRASMCRDSVTSQGWQPRRELTAKRFPARSPHGKSSCIVEQRSGIPRAPSAVCDPPANPRLLRCWRSIAAFPKHFPPIAEFPAIWLIHVRAPCMSLAQCSKKPAASAGRF